jgi:LuxR family maltose regulon positive regulatory protein
MRLANERGRELSQAFGLVESLEITGYFSGIIDYHQNNLSKAETSLTPIVTQVIVQNQRYYAESAFALASVYQAGGREEKANETLRLLIDQLLAVGNSPLMQRAQAYQADLAVRQGCISEALAWARHIDPEPFVANNRFFEPRLTLAKVLIVEGKKTSLESAAVLLQRLEAFYAGIHNTRFLIEVLALQALVCDAQGDEPTASERLTRAVHLAQPGGFIRLFVDLGPALARLLNGLDLETRESRYVARILSAFSGEGKAQTVEALDHTLTKREVEILGLLAGELSNRQISDQLCISSATVKRHTENIYQKLGVHGRHKAVAKGLGLSIIHTG